MKNLIFFVSFMFFFSIILYAQAPDTLWTKTFGGSNHERGLTVQQTTDGGYIIAGWTESFGAGDYDVYLIKTNSNGDTIWTKTFGGVDDDRAYSVKQLFDGGYIITGYTGENFPMNFADLWLLRTDSNGDTLWTKTFSGNNSDEGYSIDTTSDGGYIITGRTNYSGFDTGDVWLIKTDANGDTLWTKTFGGNLTDEGRFVQQTLDGGYIITGNTDSGNDAQDIWLLKTNANGDTIWAKIFASGSGTDEGNSVEQTTDGGYIITGVGGGNIWLIKTNSDGDTLWTKTFGGNISPSGNSVQQTSDGGYIITGDAGGDFGEYADLWLIRTDANGDTIWTKTIGGLGHETGYYVQQTFDSGYIITGYTESFGAGGHDVWLIRIAPDVTAIDKIRQDIINGYILYQNYPNPFNPTTSIKYIISRKQFVSLKVYDLLGKEISTMVNEEKPAGMYSVEFDASKLSSGIYFYQLQTGDFTKTKKMMLMR